MLWGTFFFYLAFHQHGHVHEHVVKLPDAVFQLDDLVVPRLNLVHGLLGDVVHDDLWALRAKVSGSSDTPMPKRGVSTSSSTHPRGEDGRVVALQHALQLFVRCVSAS